MLASVGYFRGWVGDASAGPAVAASASVTTGSHTSRSLRVFFGWRGRGTVPLSHRSGDSSCVSTPVSTSVSTWCSSGNVGRAGVLEDGPPSMGVFGAAGACSIDGAVPRGGAAGDTTAAREAGDTVGRWTVCCLAGCPDRLCWRRVGDDCCLPARRALERFALIDVSRLHQRFGVVLRYGPPEMVLDTPFCSVP